MSGKDSDAGSQEGCASPKMSKNDLNVGVFPFTTSYDEMGCSFEGFVWDLGICRISKQHQ